MTIYIVENYDTCEFEAFEELEQAATYVRKYYTDHVADWFGNCGDSADGVKSVLQTIKADLENLDADYPFIEDLMYIHDATLHN